MCQQTVAIVESDENNCPARHPGSGGFLQKQTKVQLFVCMCTSKNDCMVREGEISFIRDLLVTCSSLGFPSYQPKCKKPSGQQNRHSNTVCFTVTVQSCLLARPYKYCIYCVIQCFTVLLPCMKIVVIVPGYVSL